MKGFHFYLFYFFSCTNVFCLNTGDSINTSLQIDRLTDLKLIDLDEAHRNAVSLFKTKELNESDYFKIRVHNLLGGIQLCKSNFEVAKKHFNKSLLLAEEGNYFLIKGSTHEYYAYLLLEMNEVSLALRHLYKSLYYKNNYGTPKQKASVYNALGTAHFNLDALDSAAYYYNKVLIIGDEIQNSDLRVAALSNLADVYYYSDLNNLAIETYRKAYHLQLKEGNLNGSSVQLFNIGEVYFSLEKLDSAIHYLNWAKISVLNSGHTEYLLDVYFNLAEAYTIYGMADSAIVHFQAYNQLRDSIFDQGKIDAILAAEKKYQTKEAIQTAVFEKAEKEKITIEHENKRLIIYILMGTIALILIVIFFVVRNVKQKHRLKELEVDVKNQEIDNLLKDQEAKSYASLLEGQNYERERIAQDLHDRLGGTLSAVKVHFSLMDEKIQLIKQENKDLFDKVNSMLNEAVQDVRRISHDLSSGRLAKLGLRGALKDLAAIISSAKNIEVEFYMDESLPDFDKKKEQSIYAIVQELVSNMLKHANATSVEIQLNKQDDQLNLLFEDNGVGFDMQNQSYTGLGISGLSKRVEALDGTINFDSVVGRGTIVIINIPL